MAYFYQLVKLAGLAGRTYEQLYSANALGASENVRIHRALELSQELHENHAEARDENVCSTHPSFDNLEYPLINAY